MTKPVSHLACLVPLATLLLLMPPLHASARVPADKQVPRLPELQGAEPNDLTPDEARGMEQIQSLAKAFDGALGQLNPIMTDSGLTSALGDLGKQGDKLAKLARGLDEFGHPISNFNMKRIAGAFGRDKAGQAKAFQKYIGEVGERAGKTPARRKGDDCP